MESSLNTIAKKQVALLRACRLAGGRRKLAEKISATVSQIGNWVNRGDTIPYHYALLIAKATSNVITLDQLCPEMRHINRLIAQQTTIPQRVPLSSIRYYENRLPTYAKFKSVEKQNISLLTQPILVNSDYQLLAFISRLYAHQQAKSTTVPVIVIDVEHHLQTQTPIDSVIRLCPVSERVQVGEIMQQLSGNRRGRPAKSQKTQKNIFNFAGRSLDTIALLVGFGNRVTYSQAKQVLTQGCCALIQAMDSKRLSISLAARLAKFPPEQQQTLLAQDKKAIRKQMNLPVHFNISHASTTSSLSNAALFTTPQRQIDITKIYHWLLQQGAPVSLKQEGGYHLIWHEEK